MLLQLQAKGRIIKKVLCFLKENMMDKSGIYKLTVTSMILLFTTITHHTLKNFSHWIMSPLSSTQTRWAAISICWGENAQFLGKENFPYAEAAYYASQLWNSQTHGKVKPIVTVITDLEANQSEELNKYIRKIRDIPGARIVLQKNKIGNCILQSLMA